VPQDAGYDAQGNPITRGYDAQGNPVIKTADGKVQPVATHSPSLLARITGAIPLAIKQGIQTMTGIPVKDVGPIARGTGRLLTRHGDVIGGTIGEAIDGPPGAAVGTALGGATDRLLRELPEVPGAIRDIYRNIKEGPATTSKAGLDAKTTTAAERERMTSRLQLARATAEGYTEGVAEGAADVAKDTAAGASGAFVGKVGGKVVANKAMQRAIGRVTPDLLDTFKTTTKELAQTMLDKGIYVTVGGLKKLDGLLELTDQQLTKTIGSLKGPINLKRAAYNAGKDLFDRFGAKNRGNPVAGLQQIRDSLTEFVKTHAAQVSGTAAQTLKRGMGQEVKEGWGELSNAKTETLKGIYRQVRIELEQTAKAEGKGDIAALNDEERKLLAAHDTIAKKLSQATYLSPADVLYVMHHPVIAALSVSEKVGIPLSTFLAKAVNEGAVKGVNSVFLRSLLSGLASEGTGVPTETAGGRGAPDAAPSPEGSGGIPPTSSLLTAVPGSSGR
jgi:hypothetical protein